jgi:hypothetical protein
MNDRLKIGVAVGRPALQLERVTEVAGSLAPRQRSRKRAWIVVGATSRVPVPNANALAKDIGRQPEFAQARYTIRIEKDAARDCH